MVFVPFLWKMQPRAYRLINQTSHNPLKEILQLQLIGITPTRRATTALPLPGQGRGPAKLTSAPCKYPTLLILMADAKPFWSALYHSLTLMETEDCEYRRSSIYKDMGGMYQIKNDG
jgi:hypothetical protein